MDNNELYHHGVKGMKWGRRRYQNSDGTLTNVGKKRYARDAREKGYREQDSDGNYYRTNKKNKKDILDVEADRYFTEDLQRTKRLAEDSAQLSRGLKSMNDKAIKNTPKNRIDLSNMTDKELRDQINRELLERQYNDVFNPSTVSKGRETAGRILEFAGDALVVTGSALGVALSIKTLMGK